MKKKILTLTILGILPFSAYADSIWYKATKTPPQSKISFVTKKDAMIAIKKSLKSGEISDFQPVIGNDGSIKYPFGYSKPVVVGSPGHISTIKFENGFIPSGYAISQPAMWIINKAMAGDLPILLIQPRFRGLHANLVVYGKFKGKPRIYQIRLVSDSVKYTPLVGYYYPNQIMNNWKVAQQQIQQQKQQVAQETLANININDLNFNYKWTCQKQKQWQGDSIFPNLPISNSTTKNCSIAPTRVFNDGIHTYIQMPTDINHSHLPILMAKVGGKEAIVNYKYNPKQHLYIVNSVPHKIVLLLGVGHHQKKVLIWEK